MQSLFGPRRRLMWLLALVAAPLLPAAALAQGYPSKAVTFVVPYPPGGASDVIARLIGQKLSESMRQPVVIENRAGANGIIALSAVAKAPADGYTILMTNIGPSAINPSIYKSLPYDAVKDFVPITLTSQVPLMLVTTPGLGVNSVAELIAKAKASPGALSYAASGNGTAGHLAMELFKLNAGVDIKSIPYKGDTPALADMIAGQVQVMLATVIAATPHVQSGRLKALAVTTTKRLASAPSLPTIAESGMPGFEAVSWGGVMAPAGTPRAVVDKLHAEITAILKQPDVKERFAAVGAEIVSSTPEEFQRYISAETSKWARIAQTAGVRMD
jgi:tripartite-type tricarboxylate transporter receptor subunit TctC